MELDIERFEYLGGANVKTLKRKKFGTDKNKTERLECLGGRECQNFKFVKKNCPKCSTPSVSSSIHLIGTEEKNKKRQKKKRKQLRALSRHREKQKCTEN